MKITTIKEYSQDYYVTFGYNGAQFGESEEEILKGVTRNAEIPAYDSLVLNMSRYSSIPTPKFSECTFEVLSVAYSEDGKYRIYTLKVLVTWQYRKEA